MRSNRFVVIALAALAASAGPASAATWGELTSGGAAPAAPPMQPSPYAATPQAGPCWACAPQPTWGGAQGRPPSTLDAPGAAQLPPGARVPAQALLPFGRDGGLPDGQIQLWSFGQTNNTTDPFDRTGLSTPFMWVPWSTPLSAWTNAQTWNWWRERSGARSPNW